MVISSSPSYVVSNTRSNDVNLFSRSSRNIGIDLGTANTLVYVAGRGVVLSEPSVIAVDQRTGTPVAFGNAAKQMIERTPSYIQALRPLRDGVIADFETAELMLKHIMHRVHNGKRLSVPLLIIDVPSGVTALERRAVIETCLRAGARKVRLIDEPVAAALGAEVPLCEPAGNMIIDIGGGTTEVAVVSAGGIVFSESVRTAGDALSEAIALYLKKVHNLAVGWHIAEEIKLHLGSAYPARGENQKLEVSGSDMASGRPRTLTLDAVEIYECLEEPIRPIVEALNRTLERTPPQLASDIVNRGIMLTGGGALLRGLDDLLTREAGIAVYVAENPLECAVLGIGKVLENFRQLEPVLTSNLEYSTT